MQFCVPAYEVAVTNLASQSAVGELWPQWAMKKIFECPDMFHLLASAALSLLINWQKNDDNLDRNREALYMQKTKGIRELRKRLTQPGAMEDEAAVVSVIWLSHSASYMQDIDTEIIHREQVRKMTEARGGSHTYKDFVTRGLLEL
jgi:hypothetical protein